MAQDPLSSYSWHQYEGFRIMAIGNCEPQEESDNDCLSGELASIISRDQFDDEAEKSLTRYCPEALDELMRVR